MCYVLRRKKRRLGWGGQGGRGYNFKKESAQKKVIFKHILMEVRKPGMETVGKNIQGSGNN